MIEPLTGRRMVQVQERRTKKEYTLFMQELAAMYPDAEKIRVVQDNLNTHNISSFYEHLPAQQAFALAQRFEFHYAPKAASWLNMIEIEFSVLSRLCLDRRIPSQQELKREILAIVKKRNDEQVKIQWQFSIVSARTTFKRHYHKVNEGNQILKDS